VSADTVLIQLRPQPLVAASLFALLALATGGWLLSGLSPAINLAGLAVIVGAGLFKVELLALQRTRLSPKSIEWQANGEWWLQIESELVEVELASEPIVLPWLILLSLRSIQGKRRWHLILAEGIDPAVARRLRSRLLAPAVSDARIRR
jgi:hypothetical protein